MNPTERKEIILECWVQGETEIESTPAVVDFLWLGKTVELVGGDRQITDREEIEIKFDYPLRKPVIFTYQNKGGFTLSKFWECVYFGYVAIYGDEAKYGVWGHVLDGLFIEEVFEEFPGEYSMFIGS